MEKMTPLKEFSHLPNRYLVSLMLENGMEEERSGGFKGGKKKRYDIYIGLKRDV